MEFTLGKKPKLAKGVGKPPLKGYFFAYFKPKNDGKTKKSSFFLKKYLQNKKTVIESKKR